MGFIALVIALLIEQVRPLPADNAAHRLVGGLADLIRGSTDAGQRQHGAIGWALMAVVTLGLVGLGDWVAAQIHLTAVVIFFIVAIAQGLVPSRRPHPEHAA